MSSGGFTLFLEKDIMMKKRILLGFVIGMLSINGLSAAGGPAEESSPAVQYPAVPNFSPPMGGATVQEPSAEQVERDATLARLNADSNRKRKAEKGSRLFSHLNESCRDGGRKPSGGGSSGGLGGGGGSNISV